MCRLIASLFSNGSPQKQQEKSSFPSSLAPVPDPPADLLSFPDVELPPPTPKLGFFSSW